MRENIEITDKQLVETLLSGLGINSINAFAMELGYKSASSVYNMMEGVQGRKINEQFIRKVLKRYPQVNELFLRKKSEKVLLDTPERISQSNLNVSYTLNDMPILISALLAEQKKTNELLEKLLQK